MNIFDSLDEYFMRIALNEALSARQEGEIPVGAIIVCNDTIIAKAHNCTEQLHDITAHAEMLAITSATETLGSKYLSDCTLYVTLEPCIMCAGALGWSQIKRIVFGASDSKKGFTRWGKDMLHPKTEISSGILDTDCKKILQDFFTERRTNNKHSINN